MRAKVAIAAIVLLAFTACGDPVLTTPAALTGTWITQEPLKPRGSMDRRLKFNRDGTFSFRVNMYSSSKELTSYSEAVGRYTAGDGDLLFEPFSVTTWDSFYDDPQPEISELHGGIFENSTFEVQGGELTLTYLSHPADAPVITTMRFRRH